MKKGVILGIILFIIVGVAAGMSYVHFTVEKWEDKIYPNTTVKGIEIGGLTKEEALNVLEEKLLSVVLNKKIKINAEDNTYTIDYNQLKPEYDLVKVVEEAYKSGKDKSKFEKYKIIAGKDNEYKNEMDVEFKFNDAIVLELIETIKTDVNKDMVNATISIGSNGYIETTPDGVGKKVKEEELHKAIVEKINADLDSSEIVIEAGIEVVEPSVKQSELNKVNKKISESSTSYASSDAGRAANIEIAAKKINGTLLMPGEVFSFNGIVGERSEANGFKNAIVIVNNEFVDGIGGGICQVSTTLYQAILNTGLYSVERLNHTLPVGYAPLGEDATVAWGSIDYKFKNSFEYPVYIQAYTSGKRMYFKVYSNESLGNRSYEMYSKVTDTIEATMEEVKDPNLYEGERVVKKRAYNGYKVETYRKIYIDGQFAKEELISKDTYPVVNGIVNVGTKVKEPAVEESSGEGSGNN